MRLDETDVSKADVELNSFPLVLLARSRAEGDSHFSDSVTSPKEEARQPISACTDYI
jgi:hypothetical protein